MEPAEFDTPAVRSEPPPLPPLPPPWRELYRVDSSNATFAELWRDMRSPLVGFAWLSKLLRIKLPGSVNDPNVQRLSDFEIPVTQIPTDVRDRIQPMIEALESLGFKEALAYEVIDLFHGSRFHRIALMHTDGHAIATATWRIDGANRRKKHGYCEFITAFEDGTYLLTTAAVARLNSPKHVIVQSARGKSLAQTCELHEEALASRTDIRHVLSREAARSALDVWNQTLCDFHLSRGLFKEFTAQENALRAVINTVDTFHPHAGVLSQLEKLQRRQTSWTNAIVVLVISLMLFLGAGVAKWSWPVTLMLVGVLTFHELGHFIAMKVFRYRNVRMFFIPLFGAAVSGQNFTAPAWKKVLVALAGPLPGIFVAIILGFIGFYAHRPYLSEVALMALILNGINLLPVVPLDGGRVMHTLLFSRHYVLDIGFRVVATAILLIAGFMTSDVSLEVVGVALVMNIPLSYRIARIASDLRRKGFGPRDAADQFIPREIALPIIEQLRARTKRRVSDRTLAQQTLNIYETISTRRAGWLSTTGFALLHGGSLLAAVLFGAIFVVMERPDFKLRLMEMTRTKHYVSSATLVFPKSEFDATQRTALISTFSRPAAARTALNDFVVTGTDADAVELFGSSVMVFVPADHAGDIATVNSFFKTRAADQITLNPHVALETVITCKAPNDEAASRLMQELSEYFREQSEEALIPPWLPADDRSETTRHQHRVARATLTAIQKTRFAADPRVDAAEEEFDKSTKGLDPAKIDAGRQQLQDTIRQFSVDRVRGLKTESANDIDPHVVDAYLAATNDLADYAIQPAQRVGIGLLQGQLPLLDGKPQPGSEKFSTYFGSVFVQEQSLTIRCGWCDPISGLASFVRWLEANGCTNIDYQLLSSGFDTARPATAE